MSNSPPIPLGATATYRFGLKSSEGKQSSTRVNHTLPIVIEPQSPSQSSKEVLLKWISENKNWIQNQLDSYGAILFRGFGIDTAQDFEDVALNTSKYPLQDGYLGTSPRNRVTKFTFTASEFGPIVPIPQHLEMSFLPNSQPKQIFFYCQTPPENLNQGETPICDMRLVYKSLNEELRRKLNTSKIANVRNYCSRKKSDHSVLSLKFWVESVKKLDPFRTKAWEDIFETEQKQKVTTMCEYDQVQPIWKNGNELELYNEHEPIKQVPFVSPGSNEPTVTTWSNHAQVFNIDSIPIEYHHVAKRQERFLIYLLYYISLIIIFIKKLFVARHDQAQQAFLVAEKKETELTTQEMQHVSDAIWENTVFFDWRRGDVMVLNNAIISHGRMPYTQKKQKRLILTAFC